MPKINYNLNVACCKWKIIAWLVFLLFTNPLYAQNQSVFLKIDEINNLPISSVTSITQDTDGFIWIGTKNGLSRYDGHSFKLYNYTNNRLDADDVSAVFIDSRKRIWIGTLDGLHLLNKKREATGSPFQYVRLKIYSNTLAIWVVEYFPSSSFLLTSVNALMV